MPPLPGDPAELPADPLDLLREWLDDAAAQGMRDPQAMTVATSGADGRPSARMVLMRGSTSADFASTQIATR